MSRNLPQVGDGVVDGKATWQVRPWRQVELGDLMSLYELEYARTTGSVVRSEEYWRWMIGRRYAPRDLGGVPGRGREGVRLHQGP